MIPTCAYLIDSIIALKICLPFWAGSWVHYWQAYFCELYVYTTAIVLFAPASSKALFSIYQIEIWARKANRFSSINICQFSSRPDKADIISQFVLVLKYSSFSSWSLTRVKLTYEGWTTIWLVKNTCSRSSRPNWLCSLTINLILSRSLFWQQCAAVTTQKSEIIVPPQPIKSKWTLLVLARTLQ